MKVTDSLINLHKIPLNQPMFDQTLLGRKKSYSINSHPECLKINCTGSLNPSYKIDYKPIINFNNKWKKNIFCDVCNENTNDSSNFIISCNLCFNAVHQKCYGSEIETEVPFSPWFCERCTYLMSKNYNSYHIRCYFCPEVKGIIKRIGKDKWGHISCVLWTQDVCFLDNSKREEVDLSRIDSNLFGLNCYICNHKLGICSKCVYEGCELMFHVKCAQISNLFPGNTMRYCRQNGLNSILCHKHNKMGVQTIEENSKKRPLPPRKKSKHEKYFKHSTKCDKCGKTYITNKICEEHKRRCNKIVLKKNLIPYSSVNHTIDESSEQSKSICLNKSSEMVTINLETANFNKTNECNRNDNKIKNMKLRVNDKFYSFFQINHTNSLTREDIFNILFEYCSQNNIIDAESGYVLLFRDERLRTLFDRDFIRPNEVETVIEDTFIVKNDSLIEEETVGKREQIDIGLHQVREILERTFFTKSNTLNNFKL